MFIFSALAISPLRRCSINKRNKSKLQEASLQQDHFKNIESSMKTLREWKHDYKHHIQAMQILLENKRYLELQDIWHN